MKEYNTYVHEYEENGGKRPSKVVVCDRLNHMASQKSTSPRFLSQIHQILTDFQNSSTYTLYGKFATVFSHYRVKYKCQKISVRCSLGQSCWKINSPELWRMAGSKDLFITTF